MPVKACHDWFDGCTVTHPLAPLGDPRYEFDAGLHYTIPESALLLQLCTGGRSPPVECPLLGQPTTNPVSGAQGLTYDRILVGSEQPFDIQLHQVCVGAWVGVHVHVFSLALSNATE